MWLCKNNKAEQKKGGKKHLKIGYRWDITIVTKTSQGRDTNKVDKQLSRYKQE